MDSWLKILFAVTLATVALIPILLAAPLMAVGLWAMRLSVRCLDDENRTRVAREMSPMARQLLGV